MKSKKVNIDKFSLWKSDSWKSVEYYNNWFMEFAPKAFKDARKDVVKDVLYAFQQTNNLKTITADIILDSPKIFNVLRMITAPPLAQDRLVGLSYAKKSTLRCLELGKLPKFQYTTSTLKSEIENMLVIIRKMLDKDLFPWLSGIDISQQQRNRSAAIIADRLTGVLSDPLIRNAQEKRQFDLISEYLKTKGYQYTANAKNIKEMSPMTFSFHVNMPIRIGQSNHINMPIDVVIKTANPLEFPLLVECKSAGDFTNTNKRRKEEAVKYFQLKETYGDDIPFYLFLCGYFDPGYLGYEAAEGIDWIWEHRISDFELLGV